MNYTDPVLREIAAFSPLDVCSQTSLSAFNLHRQTIVLPSATTMRSINGWNETAVRSRASSRLFTLKVGSRSARRRPDMRKTPTSISTQWFK